MIKITNICPVCRSEAVLEFDDAFRGDDFPEDGPWAVPCSTCEDHLAKALNAVEDEKGNFKFLQLYEDCLHQDPNAVAAVRQMIA